MSKKVFTIITIFLMLSGFGLSQIRKDSPSTTPQRLTYTASDSIEAVFAYSIANSTVHMAYVEDEKLYYRRSINQGDSGSWESIVWVTNPGIDSWDRAIGMCAVGNYAYTVVPWRPSGTTDDFEIYFQRSIDNGATWQSFQQLTNNTGNSRRPKVACSGQYVYVIWQDDNPGNHEIYMKRNTNYGAAGYWSAPMRLSYSGGASHYPDIAASGQYVYIVWEDNNPGNYEIFFKRSNDYAATFGGVWRVTYNIGTSWNPCIATDGQYVHVVWADTNPGNNEIFYKRNTNYGLSGGWSGPVRLSYTTGDSRWPDVDCDGALVDIVWSDNNPGNYEIISKTASSYGASFGGASKWTINSGTSTKPSINSYYYDIIWQDNNPGNYEIFFKK